MRETGIGESSELAPEEERTRARAGVGVGVEVSQAIKKDEVHPAGNIVHGCHMRSSQRKPAAPTCRINHFSSMDDRIAHRNRVIRQFCPHTLLYGATERRGDLAQLFEFATTKTRTVPFWTPRRHLECASPKLVKPKCPGYLLRNLDAAFTWPKI